MSLLIIGDPHFMLTNRSDTDVLHSESVRLVKKKKPNAVIVLGDTIDSFDKVNTRVLERASNFIADLADLCKVYLLIGNHDLPDNKSPFSTTHSFTQFARSNGNVTVVDKVLLEEVCGVKTLFVPYLPAGTFMDAISKYEGQYRLVFSHQEFAGCIYHGDIETQVTERWSLEILNVSGHIHRAQYVGDYLFYAGTPYQINFGESADKKGVFILNMTSMDIERVRLRGMKQRRTVKVHYNDFDEADFGDEDRYLRVIVTCDSPEDDSTLKKSTRYGRLRRKGVMIQSKVKEDEEALDAEDEMISKMDLRKKFRPTLEEYLIKKDPIYVTMLASITNKQSIQ